MQKILVDGILVLDSALKSLKRELSVGRQFICLFHVSFPLSGYLAHGIFSINICKTFLNFLDIFPAKEYRSMGIPHPEQDGMEDKLKTNHPKWNVSFPSIN